MANSDVSSLPEHSSVHGLHQDHQNEEDASTETIVSANDAENAIKSSQGWPGGPQPLQKYRRWRHLLIGLDIVATLLPIIFIFLASAALDLNGKQRSRFGQHLIEASNYGTTAFPIVFAATMARLLRAIALYKCEVGAKLGLLEQLVGSQSLAGTIERFFSLGRYDATGIFLVLLWMLSPFGSQMTLRLLKLSDFRTTSSIPLQYFDTSIGRNSSFANGGIVINYDITAITALLQATMLWPVALTRFPMDGWGNVKVPQLPQELSVNNTKTNKWIDVDTRDHHYWVSLSGIPIQGLPDTGSSSFSLQSTYMSASCSDVMRLPTEGLAQSLERIGLLREPGLNTSVPFKPWLDDYNNNVTRSMYLSTSANYFKNAYPQQLTFYSIAASLTPGESILRIADPKSIDIFNCTLVTADIEAKIACNAKDCRAVQVRQYIAGDFASHFPLGETALERFLIRLPHSLGKAGTSSPDPADNYLLGSDSPYTLGFGAFTRDGYANVSGSVFAKRLTTLMNTAWQASLCPYGISLGSTINFTACQAVAARNIAPVANTSAEITKIIPLSVYATNKWHAIVLLLISILLQLAAFATLGLSALTKSPNILGFVSSLTRDNPYMTGVIPDGGSALDGAERARALGHVRVRLADLRPGDTIGRVVLTSDDGSNWRAMGKLSGKRRLYE